MFYGEEKRKKNTGKRQSNGGNGAKENEWKTERNPRSVERGESVFLKEENISQDAAEVCRMSFVCNCTPFHAICTFAFAQCYAAVGCSDSKSRTMTHRTRAFVVLCLLNKRSKCWRCANDQTHHNEGTTSTLKIKSHSF